EVPRQRSWTLLLYRFRGCCARLWRGKNRWFESFSKAPPVPVHRLAHGGNSVCKAPSVEYKRPALLCPRAGLPIFSVQNTEIRAPSALPPQTRPLGRVHGQAGRICNKSNPKNRSNNRPVFEMPGEGARGAGNFHFPPQF